MQHRFKDYFRFNRSERKGIFILLFLIIAVLIIKESLIYFNPEVNVHSKEADRLISLLDKNEIVDQAKGITENKMPIRDTPIEYVDFDPNELTLNGWVKLGLSEKQAEVIMNYREKGGEFREKKDVQKMYTISDEVYERLEPYILLPEKEKFKRKEWKQKNKKDQSPQKWEPVVVNINLADSFELQEVYGIGSYFAAEIVKRREELGGYVEKSQLLEIWGFSDSMLVALEDNLEFSPIELRRIDINSADAEELKMHPYINWNMANSIVNIRKQHGTYQNLKDLKKSVLINDSIFQRIEPYLKNK